MSSVKFYANFIIGDVNNDGQVKMTDYELLKSYLLGAVKDINNKRRF